MSEHTPGPWSVKDRRASKLRCFLTDAISKDDFPYSIVVPAPPLVYGAIGALVAQDKCGNKGCVEANARLIAAAPAMLEALRTIERNTVHANTRMIARGAIVEAEGA